MINPSKAGYFFQKTNLEEVFSRLASRDRFALFLDFDGTLVPIQEDPSSCALPEELRRKLSMLSNSGRCCMIISSGRSLTDIRHLIGLPGIYYSGNHGLVISGRGMNFVHPRALAARRLLHAAVRMLKREIAGLEGAWIENKGVTASLHYRSVRRAVVPSVRKAFHGVASRFTDGGGLAVIRGKKVLEFVPDVSWTKGSAALWVLDSLGGKLLPVCVGDDVTDESMFRAFRRRGITIRVGCSERSEARYCLKGQREISRLLDYLLLVPDPGHTRNMALAAEGRRHGK